MVSHFNNKMLSLSEACERLSISTATGRNWIRLGKLEPAQISSSIPYFTVSYIEKIKSELESGKNTALKSRRNKTYVSGNAVYNGYAAYDSPNLACVLSLSGAIEDRKVPLTAESILYLVAECALRLLMHSAAEKNGTQTAGIDAHYVNQHRSGSYLFHYVNQSFPCIPQASLVEPLIAEPHHALAFIRAYPELFEQDYVYVPGEDTLGLVLQSLQNTGERKAKGAYYTPADVVRTLISHLDVTADSILLDPCCGTGNFLLQLPQGIPFEHIYAMDIDPVSVHLARIQAAMHFDIADPERLASHISCGDFLHTDASRTYDFIIGNPPWGYAFSKEEKQYLASHFTCASSSRTESFAVFLEHAISLLAPAGCVSFVLPESVLTVKCHRKIREQMLRHCRIRHLDYLGNVFDGVQCPCIIAQWERTEPVSPSPGSFVCTDMEVSTQKRTFTITQERILSPDYLCFYADDIQYAILHKLLSAPHTTTLKGQADFALGIVTGNNKAFLSTTARDGMEPILKGTDIHKFAIRKCSHFITFEPEQFQQAANMQMYRAPEKLVYRFVNSQLVFAYDNEQRLTLNSCNILIPRIEGLHIKYILAVLNSRIAQFVVDMRYHSVKILRSHLETIPIPIVDTDTQEAVIALVEQLQETKDQQTFDRQYQKLDSMLAGLYGISAAEYKIITDSTTK